MSNPTPEILNEMVEIHYQAKNDLLDTAILISTAVENLTRVIEGCHYCEPAFDDVFRVLRIAKDLAYDSADWHNSQAIEIAPQNPEENK